MRRLLKSFKIFVTLTFRVAFRRFFMVRRKSLNRSLQVFCNVRRTCYVVDEAQGNRASCVCVCGGGDSRPEWHETVPLSLPLAAQEWLAGAA